MNNNTGADLPKLLSGEVRIRGVERQVEGLL